MPDQTELIVLVRQIEAGKLQPIVRRGVPLADGRAAFEAKRTPGVPSKIMLAVRVG